jgi:hypothetical protein
MPLTVISLLGMTTALSLLHGRQWRHVGPILLTCAVLLALLGLIYLAVFVGLERRSFAVRPRPIL